jgi:hypothetical protein
VLRAGAAVVAGGVVLGGAAALADTTNALILNVANLPAAWAMTAFLVGTVARRPAPGAAAGVAALLLAIAIYYVALLQSGSRVYIDSTVRAAEVWGLVAVPVGLAMGFCGALVAGRGRLMAPALGVAAGVLWGEALFVGPRIADAHGSIWIVVPFAEGALGALLVLTLPKTWRARLAAASVAAALAFVAAGGMAADVNDTIRCAAGDWCGGG